MDDTGCACIGNFVNSSSGAISVNCFERWERDLPASVMAPGMKVHARMLVRGEMVELYVNDYLFPVWSGQQGTGATYPTGIYIYYACEDLSHIFC